MTGRQELFGLSAAEIASAFGGAAQLQADGVVTLQLTAPITVDGEMGLRGRKALSFDQLMFRPLPGRLKVSGGDRLLSALAASLQQTPKVAKRIYRGVAEEDWKRLRVLLGHVMMVADRNDDAKERTELLALLHGKPTS